MSRDSKKMSPNRLCDAAEASLRAAADFAESHDGPWPSPVDLFLSANRPACMDDFERWEIEEACAFLARLGYIEHHRTRGAA